MSRQGRFNVASCPQDELNRLLQCSQAVSDLDVLVSVLSLDTGLAMQMQTACWAWSSEMLLLSVWSSSPDQVPPTRDLVEAGSESGPRAAQTLKSPRGGQQRIVGQKCVVAIPVNF